MKNIILLCAAFCMTLTSCQTQVRQEQSNFDINIDEQDFLLYQNRSARAVLRDTIYKPNLNFTLGKSFIAENLEIIQILTNAEVQRKYVTLGEAMKNKWVTVIETEQVSQLAIENNSDYYIFINSGDIVKGGKQDRTLQYDVIVPPKSGKMDLASFCVESGRWQKRSGEDLANFSSNSYMISSKDLKVSVRHKKVQGSVWNNVKVQQNEINEKAEMFYDVEVDVKDEVSETSLQLSLENEKLNKIKEELKIQFKDFVEPNVLGYAYVINGELYGIEVYNSQKLFNDLWSKHLNAILTESLSEKKENYQSVAFSKEALIKEIGILEVNQKVENINSNTTMITGESKNNDRAIFTTIDKELSQWIHRSYLPLD